MFDSHTMGVPLVGSELTRLPDPGQKMKCRCRCWCWEPPIPSAACPFVIRISRCLSFYFND